SGADKVPQPSGAESGRLWNAATCEQRTTRARVRNTIAHRGAFGCERSVGNNRSRGKGTRASFVYSEGGGNRPLATRRRIRSTKRKACAGVERIECSTCGRRIARSR